MFSKKPHKPNHSKNSCCPLCQHLHLLHTQTFSLFNVLYKIVYFNSSITVHLTVIYFFTSSFNLSCWCVRAERTTYNLFPLSTKVFYSKVFKISKMFKTFKIHCYACALLKTWNQEKYFYSFQGKYFELKCLPLVMTFHNWFVPITKIFYNLISITHLYTPQHARISQ